MPWTATMPKHVFPAVFDQLAEAQISRTGYIRATNRLMNDIKARARRAMGWSLALPEAERVAINKRATAFVQHAMAHGTVPDGEDERLFDALVGDMEIYRQATAPLIASRARIEKEMRKKARFLPVWENFSLAVKGLDSLGFAVIVPECCDLSKYAGPAKVWKRLGLGPFNGKAGSTWRREG